MKLLEKSWDNTICSDWDGVWEVFPHPKPYTPEPVEGLQKGVGRLLDAGWYIEIFSGGSKHPKRLKVMQDNFLEWFGQEFWNEYVETGRIAWATNKPTAKVYLDDRGMCFTGWNVLTPELLQGFRAWWQHPRSTS